MRVPIDWRSASKENYNNFKSEKPEINLSFDDWKRVVYGFNEMFVEHMLETGEKVKLPCGIGDFAINKKKRVRTTVVNGKEYINLPIDWKKTREKGKYIYNFNYHTEGYFFGWMWFKETARLKNTELWYFKPTRTTSRLLSHYIKTDDKYQCIYREWKK